MECSRCPYFSNTSNIIWYILIGIIIFSISSVVLEEWFKPGMFQKNHSIIIDKCPLASNKDQRIAIIESKLDVLFDKIDSVHELILDNIASEEDIKEVTKEETKEESK